MNTQQLTNRLSEAVSHHKAGRYDRAEAIYRQLAPLAKTGVIYDLWGQLAEVQARYEDALRFYAQAMRLDERTVGIALRIANVHIALGRPAEAEKTLRRYLQKYPESAEAWNALGYALKLLGRLPEAMGCHERAVKINPEFIDGWVHYGLTCALLGKNFQALQYHEKALAIRPDFALARYGRAETLHKVYRLEEAIADYDAFLKVQPRHLEAYSYRLFALENLETMSPEKLFAEHVAYGKIVGTGPAMLPGYDLSPDKRLRVAILSPDFRTHSCAYFIEPLLQHLDRSQFEVYLYHDHFSEDAISARLKKLAAVWRNFVGQPHGVVEKIVRADRPDIFIDLTGHIGNTIRLPMLAKRVAPVQITYLGYPDTTGVPAIDFRFTDPIADPVGEADKLATEKLVRFAPVAWAYQAPVDAPDVVPPPLATGADHVTFGCFNSPTKFTDSLFRAWAMLLTRVPNARLLLKGRDFEEEPVRKYILHRLGAQGVPLDRIDLLPRTPLTSQHLPQYGMVDVALDTFPYNGTTTTCEAMWMGRPVVTLRGNRHAARVGASLLTAVGHPEWIARDAEEYVEIAMKLAQDPARLATESARLRGQIIASPLMDHVRQSARFGIALRACWIARCAGQVMSATAEANASLASL